MALKRQLILVCGSIALLSGIALVAEIRDWFDQRAYNEAVAAGRYSDASGYAGAYGLFARAFDAQAQGSYQEARVIYSRLENTDDRQLQAATLFNLGNSYLEQASAIDMEADSDLALPLIELAKASYRELLHLDSGHWAGRYNLERALELLPDAQEHALMEIQGRRGAVRTIISRDPEDNLP